VGVSRRILGIGTELGDLCLRLGLCMCLCECLCDCESVEVLECGNVGV
jgi:hypothetical protein